MHSVVRRAGKNADRDISDPIAEQHLHESIMPGYTHLQKAQPITLAHHMMAYAEMFKRDYRPASVTAYKRDGRHAPGLRRAGGATTYPLDSAVRGGSAGLFRYYARIAWTAFPTEISAVEFLSAAATILMMHLSRFCEELILWSHQRICLRRDGRRLFHRLQHHAPEEEPGYVRS